jgi:hypothetical protein
VFGLSAPAGRHWSAPTTTQQKKVLILTMKFWKMKKSCDFDHEINLVEKHVGTPATLGRTLGMAASVQGGDPLDLL